MVRAEAKTVVGVPPGDGGVFTDASTVARRDPKTVYAEKWINAEQTREPLYTQRTGTVSTPLLDSLVLHLGVRAHRRSRRQGSTPLTIIEAGAGPGDHAFHIASELPATNVLAVDSSAGAIARIERRIPEEGGSFSMGSEVIPVAGDALELLKKAADDSLDGFHANSFFHFLTPEQRAEYLLTLRDKLSIGSAAGFSYKEYDSEDPLLTDPKTVIVHEDHRGVLAIPPDGVQRLFVKDTEGIEQEALDAGLTPVGIFRWSLQDYDKEGRAKGKPSNFVGILVEKGA